MDFKSKKVLVLGAGSSGFSAAKFLHARGAVVGIYDDEIAKGKVYKGVPYAIYLQDEKQVEAENFDFCVISPGVSKYHNLAQKFEGKIISELALGFQTPHKKIVAVTGTNGKTSVTNMLGEALGTQAVVCGNIGIPVTSVTDKLAKKIAVTEVSSFMMETPEHFCPDIAIILNITQDHLERHKTMDEYIKCKAAISRAQTKRDFLILNYDDENCRAVAQVKCLKTEANGMDLSSPQILFFSCRQAVKGIYLDGKNVVLNIKKHPEVIFNIEEFCEEKPHQIQNILAVILACKLLGIGRNAILKACMGRKKLENRIQHVGQVENVMFYNDSKATNIAACLAACKCFQSPINLLLGGQVKGQNFDELFAGLPKIVEHVFCFGQGADVIMKAAQEISFTNITKCKDMEDAVLAAYQHGFGPRVVLLSPACASFDAFNGYADRGQKFIEIVESIANDGVTTERREARNEADRAERSDMRADGVPTSEPALGEFAIQTVDSQHDAASPQDFGTEQTDAATTEQSETRSEAARKKRNKKSGEPSIAR